MKKSRILFSKNLSFLLLAMTCLSCSKQKTKRQSFYPTIKTYTSPSAYYQKPISRIYMNPYSPNSKDVYFDNDYYYKPPKNYGITKDNYNPYYVQESKRSYFGKIRATFGILGILAVLLAALAA